LPTRGIFNVRRISYLRAILIAFACFETVLAFAYLISVATAVITSGNASFLQLPQDQVKSPLGFLWSNSVPLTVAGWASVGLVTWWKRDPPREWKDAGLDRETFDLMVRMRGAASRLAILRYLDSPKHRSAIAEITGTDWKEVDRQLNLLCKFGLVSVAAEAGAMKMYELTEHGKLMLTLLVRLNNKIEKNATVTRA
jgi:predicted transcriptional regulator